MPSEATKSAAKAGQSSPGTAATCALKLPLAPFTLPSIRTCAHFARARFSRYATFAISLPSVVGELELGSRAVELGDRGAREGLQRLERGARGERLQPLDFDAHALAHQGEFAEVILERPGLGGVAPVEGREGREGRGHAGEILPPAAILRRLFRRSWPRSAVIQSN